MQEQFQRLVDLLDYIPSYNSSSCYSQFDSVLAKYIQILNSINCHNDEYKRSTNLYYNDISMIRENLQSAVYSNTSDKRMAAYEKAVSELKTDILALASLIKPKEKTLAEFA